MRRLLPLLGLGLVACAPGGDAASADDTDVAAFDGAKLKEISDGQCPDLTTSGLTSFRSGGLDRDVVVRLPDRVTPGLPVVFVWHGLGDSAASMDVWMDLGGFARDHDTIVIVPDSADRNGTTWDVLGGGADATLFDDLRSCLARDLEVDLARISATGFSFGGLWTTWLTMNRAKALSTTLPMSGGTDPYFLQYDAPKVPLPVLLMWGGSSDTYGSGTSQVRFEETTLAFSAALRADDSLVVHCNHNGGHTVPNDIHDVAAAWLLGHRYGAPSPFEDSLGTLPSYCTKP